MLTAEPTPQIGPLLRHWRAARRMSQLDLALEANVSTRHISFVETGRAQPSRQLVLALADVLAVPPRERNALLLAAGYAPLYRETDLAAPAMGQVRRALALILRQQDPFPTIALDRGWQLVMVNSAWARLAAHLGLGALPALTVLPEPRPNLLRLLCDPVGSAARGPAGSAAGGPAGSAAGGPAGSAARGPAGLRPHLANWEVVARNLLHRARHDAANHPPTAALLDELAARPDLAAVSAAGQADWHEPTRESAPGLLLPVTLRLGERRVHLLSTITTLGTAQDLTLQELHIEALYPADADAEAVLRRVGEWASGPVAIGVGPKLPSTCGPYWPTRPLAHSPTQRYCARSASPAPGHPAGCSRRPPCYSPDGVHFRRSGRWSASGDNPVQAGPPRTGRTERRAAPDCGEEASR